MIKSHHGIHHCNPTANILEPLHNYIERDGQSLADTLLQGLL